MNLYLYFVYITQQSVIIRNFVYLFFITLFNLKIVIYRFKGEFMKQTLLTLLYIITLMTAFLSVIIALNVSR